MSPDRASDDSNTTVPADTHCVSEGVADKAHVGSKTAPALQSFTASEGAQAVAIAQAEKDVEVAIPVGSCHGGACSGSKQQAATDGPQKQNASTTNVNEETGGTVAQTETHVDHPTTAKGGCGESESAQPEDDKAAADAEAAKWEKWKARKAARKQKLDSCTEDRRLGLASCPGMSLSDNNGSMFDTDPAFAAKIAALRPLREFKRAQTAPESVVTSPLARAGDASFSFQSAQARPQSGSLDISIFAPAAVFQKTAARPPAASSASPSSTKDSDPSLLSDAHERRSWASPTAKVKKEKKERKDPSRYMSAPVEAVPMFDLPVS
eukprot:TRINITY_DN92223_c0_g1_i1.p1 TRINITY_DN92223_c0_g1~~TRINITY_DN92223_c0_g1_i1.p1  ORF type:complete len:323 (+),score=45.71 TRINITY_DN92223_c0_g1_i1:89-1057(+)